MSVLISYPPVADFRWQELREVPLGELMGIEGLRFTNLFHLWTTMQVEVDGEPLMPDWIVESIGLAELAFTPPQVVKDMLFAQSAEWFVGYDGPRMVITTEGDHSQIALFKWSVPADPDVPDLPIAVARCRTEELISALKRCSDEALADLHAGMTGPLAPILEEWERIMEPFAR